MISTKTSKKVKKSTGARRQGAKKARRPSVVAADLKKQKEVLPSADMRNTPSATQLFLSNSLNTIALTKYADGYSQLYFPIGYLANALQKGYIATQIRSYEAAFAWQYMSNLMTAYMSSTTPLGISVPYWFLCFLQGIQPKTARFGGGHATYQWETSSLTINNGTAVLGYDPYGYQFTVLPPEGTPLPGGIPTAGYNTAPPTYTDVLGGQAFQKLVNFMETREGTTMAKKTPISVSTSFCNDVSAFAIVTQAEGLGATGAGGGIYAVASHEVKVTTPLLAVSLCGNDTESLLDPTRSNIRPWTVAGDPVYAGFIGSNVTDAKGLYDRVRPVFKSVDFLEFLDVFALYVTKMTQSYFDKLAASTATVDSYVTCPLTLQECGLLLRNTIMSALKNTQPAVQGIYPIRPASPIANEFVPYVTGSNTCAISVSDMQYPMAFIENIQCLSARASHKTGEVYFPVLGQYRSDSLNWKDYTVTYTPFLIDGTPPTPVTRYVFADPTTLYYKKTTAKDGSVSKVYIPEPAISYVDGASGTDLAFINDPNYLSVLSSKYNDWFNIGPNTFSTKVGKFNSQGGLNALACSPMTRVWYGADQLKVPRPHVVKTTDVLDSRSESRVSKRMAASIYTDRLAIAATSNGPLFSTAYEQFLSLWILPQIQNEVQFDAGGNVQSTALTRWQGIVNEPFLASTTSGDNGKYVSTLHESYASKLVRSELAPADDWETLLQGFEDSGRGGIFSSLAGMVGSIFPGAAGIAGTIGGIADAVTGM